MPSPDTACVRAPASKSISHRYCIGAALAHGTSELHHVLDSRDLECTRAILCAAGARMEALPGEEGGWRVTGMDGRGDTCWLIVDTGAGYRHLLLTADGPQLYTDLELTALGYLWNGDLYPDCVDYGADLSGGQSGTEHAEPED